MANLLQSKKFKSYIQFKLPTISSESVEVVYKLAEEKATVPFIARYRKDQTGGLDEVQVRALLQAFEDFDALEKRRTFILAELTKQKNLTDHLRTQIEVSLELRELEEFYRPYKRKRKTKSGLAREAGLQPLADWIWELAQGRIQAEESLEVRAKKYINPKKLYATYQEVILGAQHIIAEKLYTHIELRKKVKDEFIKSAKIKSQQTTYFKKNSKFSMYKDYEDACKKLLEKKSSHRYLALRRGWQEKELKITIEANNDTLLKFFQDFALKVPKSVASDVVLQAAKTAFEAHVLPSVSNEWHALLKEIADVHAAEVFANNVKKVLMSSPFGAKVVLGIDPGLKTGCKMALVDGGGRFISHVLFHTLKEEDLSAAKKLFLEVLAKVSIEGIAVGNGTGGREAERFVRKVLKSIGKEAIPVVVVNESGASVYSASEIARSEFPDLDLTVRGAVSIARRLQDPLAELVKIDPKSIGVGQYQHDIAPSLLKKSLQGAVESCVNQVGVNLNTASSFLLQYVSGIGPAIAKNIVDHRSQNGLFKGRSELLNVASFSSKAFEQAAGFLRLPNSDVLLDKTGIHPERYSVVRDMALDLKMNISQLMEKKGQPLKEKAKKWSELIGEYTFLHILNEFEKPGLDPRKHFQNFQFRDDLKEIKDLKEGEICPGVVTNVTNFGAFVDVGVHQDGLVHVSELSHDFISDPKLVVSPGDQVKVKVLSVDIEKSQISFSMRLGEAPKVKVKERPKREKSKKSSGALTDKAHQKPRSQKERHKKTGSSHRKASPTNKSSRKPFNNPFSSLKN